MTIIKTVRADQIRVGDKLWYHGRVIEVNKYGPMFGEATGYTRNVEIVCAPEGGCLGTVLHTRGDLPVKQWIPFNQG